MSDITITCPHCGFTKEAPRARVPQKEVQVTCPKCYQIFPLSAGNLVPPESSIIPPQAAPATAGTPPVQNSAETFKKTSITELPIQQGGSNSKALLLVFLLIVIILVGVRLWADSKKRSVPFPNFIATAAQGVAVSWGQEIYLLDHAGKVVGKQSLPQDVILTQVQFIGEELWIANITAKSIQRLRNNKLETVVNGSGKFRGPFKFAVDLKAGLIFVTDASNHKVHIYSTDGTHLTTFGTEGKNPGELKFPNSIVFDRDGNLLIVNTNAHRLDLFSRQGEYLKTFAQVKAKGNYRYPTLLTQAGDRVAFLLTVDLRKAKVVMYGTDGQSLGELVAPMAIDESGDVAAWEGKVFVTDNKQREIYKFSADNLEYMGPFSEELEGIAVQATALEARYAKLSNGALIALLIACVPVFYFYYRMRQHEQLKVEATDYSAVIPQCAILGAETNRQKLALAALAVLIVILWAFLMLFGAASGMKNPALMPFILLGNLVLSVGAIRLFMESGFGNPARMENIEKLAKAASARVSRILATGETVEVCTALQRKTYLKQPSLLLFTNRRILILDYAAAQPTGCAQLGYGDIFGMTMEPVKINLGSIGRFLKTELFRINLALTGSSAMTSLQFSGMDRQILERIRQIIEEKRPGGAVLGYAMLCDKCNTPLGPNGCLQCQQDKKANWKPLILSLLYPGFGQFYNREIWKGCAFSISFTLGVILLTIPVITILDRSSEFTRNFVLQVVQFMAVMLIVYILSAADADQVGRKGRKLFSRDLFRRKY